MTNLQYNNYPVPWNKTLTPLGTYQLPVGVTQLTIEVDIGTAPNNVFT